ncbi:hypothetical protein BCT90_09980, partial [Vibrio lentus]|uniref:glycosyltransferase n=1 Tax=Vibrio lentus TaxID=136468 RepID=UPI000C839C65
MNNEIMTTELVSVYIPTHFRPELLDRAIKSVFNQYYKNVEVVVCIDGECLKTLDVVNKWVEDGFNLLYHVEKTPKGACFCRNKAISMCTGTFITGLDDDDYFQEKRITDFMRNYNNEREILYTNYTVKSNDEKFRISPAINVGDRIYEFNYIGNQVFFHRSVAKCDIFCEDMPAWQDYEAWLSLYDKGYKFKLLNLANYVVDLSHPHERITKNTKKINKAYELIVNKHNRFKIEPNKSFLKYSLYRYPGVKIKIEDI